MIRLWLGLILAGTLSACAPASYAVRAPEASGLKYSPAEAPVASHFSLLDERKLDARVFSSGTLNAELKINEVPIAPLQFLAKHVQAELVSRGLPVQFSATGGAPPRIHVKDFRILNTRTNAYTPFITLTFLSADVDTPTGPKRLGVFVTRGKTPVWSFDEVVEPAFNQPLALVIQEFASKLANAVYGYRASDEEVKRLIAKVKAPVTPETFLDVYELGFSNNPLAIPTLVQLTDDANEYVRQAAVASLGNLGAANQLALLKSIYQDQKNSWQDRCHAIKSIADLGTPEANTFAAAEAKRLAIESSDKADKFLKHVLALYY